MFLLHKSNAAYVSAVSPDWDTKIYKVSDLNDRHTIGYINVNIVPIEDVPNPISFDISIE